MLKRSGQNILISVDVPSFMNTYPRSVKRHPRHPKPRSQYLDLVSHPATGFEGTVLPRACPRVIREIIDHPHRSDQPLREKRRSGASASRRERIRVTGRANANCNVGILRSGGEIALASKAQEPYQTLEIQTLSKP